MKKPFYYFWRPLNFEVTKTDLRLVPDRLVKTYFEVIEAYWLADCDLPYQALREGFGSRGKDLDALFDKVKSLSIVDGNVYHAHTLHEFSRAIQRSGSASQKAKARWGKADNAD
jgi:hypothetical protein